MMERIRSQLQQVSEARERFGLAGAARLSLGHVLRKGASVRLIHTIALDPDHMRIPPVDGCIETRFLTVDEIRRFAENPANNLPPEFAERAEGGHDACFGAIHGDRLANYGWYAFGSAEPEHSAGAGLGLPKNLAYMYKVFTRPDFRGRHLNGASMGRALLALSARGVDQLVSLVDWSNQASLRSCRRLGFRRLGMLMVGPWGPVRVPAAARRLGVTFGDDAGPALAARERRATASLPPSTRWERPSRRARSAGTFAHRTKGSQLP